MRFCLSAASVLIAALQAHAAAPSYAITNARIVAGPGQTIERGVIILRNGLIESVGEGLPIPPDARIFDAAGITVYPGLIDGATHYGFPAPPRAPAPAPSGPAQVPEDIAAPHRYLRPQPAGMNADVVAAVRLSLPPEPDVRLNQGFTTVLAVPREGHWRGVSALVNLAGAARSDVVVASPVAMHVSFTTSFGPGRRYPTSLMGVLAALRQSLVSAEQYRDAIRLYEESGKRGLARPAFDPVSAALLPVLMAVFLWSFRLTRPRRSGELSVLPPSSKSARSYSAARKRGEWPKNSEHAMFPFLYVHP
jgi:cytosine/adenosine deaminase-related metal-dependent hydrolase